MAHLLHKTCDSLHRTMTYRRAVAELRALPIDVRLDLDIAGIEDKVAHRAVYGA